MYGLCFRVVSVRNVEIHVMIRVFAQGLLAFRDSALAIAIFVAGTAFCDSALPIFVAGAACGDSVFVLFVAGGAFFNSC